MAVVARYSFEVPDADATIKYFLVGCIIKIVLSVGRGGKNRDVSSGLCQFFTQIANGYSRASVHICRFVAC